MNFLLTFQEITIRQQDINLAVMCISHGYYMIIIPLFLEKKGNFFEKQVRVLNERTIRE